MRLLLFPFVLLVVVRAFVFCFVSEIALLRFVDVLAVFVCCVLFVVCCESLLLCVPCSLLLLSVVRGVLFDVYYELFVVCCWFCVDGCLLFVFVLFVLLCVVCCLS